MTRPWRFYQGVTGGSPVTKELAKAGLTAAELAKIQLMMDRVKAGRARPGEVKILRDGVRELRARVDRRTFRLLYAEVGDASEGSAGPALLVLHLFQKQRQVEKQHIDLAVDRLRDWRTRHR